ncbi:MAG: D-glycero-beta-D-manno-heptose 1-phosphate adenylyltransferase [Spirochaetes bacterium]|jgi:rfaE bifunctional protein nucleotidyltransferase chain/domain|nr:D-glycero-beta-D-manno-heptose 1-phosphate adenylyltransferase [Spirochaetota bacterium]
MKVKHFREKIAGIDEIEKISMSAKKKGQTIVTSNGCFDILHSGHIEYLEGASMLGDILIIGINSDSSVRKLKGKERPVNGEIDRASLVASLGFVDYCVIFNEDTPVDLLKKIRPDIHVKGGDYKADEIIEKKIVEDNGGIIRILPLVRGYSTTGILDRLTRK